MVFFHQSIDEIFVPFLMPVGNRAVSKRNDEEEH